MRVLVVDDDESVRALVRRILEADGQEVDEAGTGREAVAAYRRQPADVVLLDLIMPDQDGIETLGEFRRIAADVKVVAMTGGDLVHLRSARLLGATGVLRKPFRRAELLASIHAVMGD